MVRRAGPDLPAPASPDRAVSHFPGASSEWLLGAFQGTGPVSRENQASHDDPDSVLRAGVQGGARAATADASCAWPVEQVFGVMGENFDAAKPDGRSLAGEPVLKV